MTLDQQDSPPADQVPGGGDPITPAKTGTSGLAVAGLILAFLMAPVGLILSIIGLITTSRSGKKGKGLAISGIIVSLLLIAGGIAAVAVAANKVSTVVDPGCTTGKDAIFNNADKLSSSDPATIKSGIQATVDGLDSAASQAKHDNVRDAMTALRDDYQQLLDSVNNGTPPDAALDGKISKDADAIDALCTVGS